MAKKAKTIQEIHERDRKRFEDNLQTTQRKKPQTARKKPTPQPRPKPQEALQIEPTATNETEYKRPRTLRDYPSLYDAFRSHDADSTHAAEEVETESTSKNFTPEPYLFPTDGGIVIPEDVVVHLEPEKPVAYEAPRHVRTHLKELSEEQKKSRRKKIIAIVSALVVIALGLVFAFTLRAWWQWQHVIGSFGGAVAVAGTALLAVVATALFADHTSDVVWESACCVAFMAVLVANAVLTFVLGSKYNVISYWINGWSIAASGFFGVGAVMSDDTKKLGIPFFAEMLIAIIVIVLRALLPL